MFISFYVVLKIILTIPLVTKPTRLILTLVISTCLPMSVVNEERETPLPSPDKTSKDFSA